MIPAALRSIVDYTASRTKWLDDYFLAAGASGLTQVMILAAGLDARARRLPWLHDAVVYEVGRPEVLAFKTMTLEAAPASPSVRHVQVAADL